MEKRGRELLNDPIMNRGTAFSFAKRDRLGLRGMLPAGLETLERQMDRVLELADGTLHDVTAGTSIRPGGAGA